MENTHESGRPAPAGRLARDFFVGVAILAFCAAAYWVSLDIKEAPAALAQNVQPATFPKLVIAVIAVLTLLMMVLGISRREPQRPTPRFVTLGTAVAMLCFVAAFETLGLPVSIALFCLVMPVVWGARPSWALVVYAIAFPAAIYLVFVVALGVYIQPGILAQLVKSVI